MGGPRLIGPPPSRPRDQRPRGAYEEDDATDDGTDDVSAHDSEADVAAWAAPRWAEAPAGGERGRRERGRDRPRDRAHPRDPPAGAEEAEEGAKSPTWQAALEVAAAQHAASVLNETPGGASAVHAAAEQTAEALEAKLRSIQLAAARDSHDRRELLEHASSAGAAPSGGGGRKRDALGERLGEVRSSMTEHLARMQDLRSQAAAAASSPTKSPSK